MLNFSEQMSLDDWCFVVFEPQDFASLQFPYDFGLQIRLMVPLNLRQAAADDVAVAVDGAPDAGVKGQRIEKFHLA